MDVTTFRDGVRERLGEILVRKGRLSPDQLDEAIVAAKASGDRLGAHLVNAKALHEEDISIVLADQFGLRYVVVDVQNLSTDLGALMPERTARRLSVLPLSASGDRVRLAIADPTDVVIIDELRMALNGAFDLVVADPTTIRAGLDQVIHAISDPPTTRSPRRRRKRSTDQSAIDVEADAESAPAVEEVNRLLRTAIELAPRTSTLFPGRTTFMSAPVSMG